MPVPPPPPKPEGEVLDGHWRLERKLGKGGMGTVYLAHDLELERLVAIKMLAPQYCDDPGLVQRFEREARMMAKLDHPNLVPVFSVGRTPKGPYIVMKLLEGMTLAETLKTRGRMALPEAIRATRQVAAGLQFIHDRQVIHRDIKPANIFVGPDGHVTLLDLGVARDSTSDLTRTGVLLGTPRYMSPEQIHGEPADHRSDLYALATVVYEMVTGQPVFEANSDFSLMKAHIDQAPPDPSKFVDVPPALASALLKALAKNPAERFQSARQLAEALEEASGLADAGRGPPSLIEVLSPTIPPARATPRPELGVGLMAAAGQDATQFNGVPSMGTDGPSAEEPGQENMGLWIALAVLVLLSGGGVSYLFFDGGGSVDPVAPVPRLSPPVEKAAVVPVPPVEVTPHVPPTTVPPEPSTKVPEVTEGPGVEPKPRPLPNVGATSPRGPRGSDRGPRVAKATSAEPDAEPEKKVLFGVVRCLVMANKMSSWAYVEVDGMRHGATPLVLKLEPGRHELVFMRSGFKTQSREVMLAPGDDTKLLVEMAP